MQVLYVSILTYYFLTYYSYLFFFSNLFFSIYWDQRRHRLSQIPNIFICISPALPMETRHQMLPTSENSGLRSHMDFLTVLALKDSYRNCYSTGVFIWNLLESGIFCIFIYSTYQN